MKTGITGRAGAVLALFCAACGETGQDEVAFDATGAGVTPEPFAAGEWTVTLDVAKVAFGPAYFCASAAADAELCATAVVEYADTGVVDATDPAPQPLGEIHGATGAVRSATFDYGLSWPAVAARPRASTGAPSGHSAVFEGSAVKDAVTVHFRAFIDVLPLRAATFSVVAAPARHDVTTRDAALTVRLDPTAWWAEVDFDALAAAGEDPAVVRAGDPAHDTVLFGMTSRALPAFEWTPADHGR
jgi:hypothetical protein